MPLKLQRAKGIPYKTTESEDLGDGNDANADEYFDEDNNDDVDPQINDDTIEIDVISPKPVRTITDIPQNCQQGKS